MAKIVVITGAGAGVGRATVNEFARNALWAALAAGALIGLRQLARRLPAGR